MTAGGPTPTFEDIVAMQRVYEGKLESLASNLRALRDDAGRLGRGAHARHLSVAVTHTEDAIGRLILADRDLAEDGGR